MSNIRFADALEALRMIRDDGAVTSYAIAAVLGTNPSAVRRGMMALRNAEIVTARRGPGGYSLAKPASEISLFEVWIATQDSADFIQTRPDPFVAVTDTVASINMAFARTLDGMTLAQVGGKETAL